ncbi:hypothetical protein HYH03_003653 [Edaphochlamys debaryana]|uniref:Peptidase S74 domain-containing protein n=1 Tax=Edaphochlamys debaryana TaxID=47281 RepID=A0A835YIQ9_9CHLO|nr:hypothetical protein HYH03_003653 [Edaphochlamys debaryana]|eukprot:KAG2498394.1 hypothetical protein HYH03_003653 [Edaphochlamys debaryana]
MSAFYNGTEYMTIRTAGGPGSGAFLGINTQTPQDHLQVRGNATIGLGAFEGGAELASARLLIGSRIASTSNASTSIVEFMGNTAFSNNNNQYASAGRLVGGFDVGGGWGNSFVKVQVPSASSSTLIDAIKVSGGGTVVMLNATVLNNLVLPTDKLVVTTNGRSAFMYGNNGQNYYHGAEQFFQINGITRFRVFSDVVEVTTPFQVNGNPIYNVSQITSTNNVARFTFCNNSHSQYFSPGSHLFYGNGIQNMSIDINGNVVARGTLTGASDMRLKTDLVPVTGALRILQDLTGYTFRRVDMESSRRYIGLIAQDVQKVLPEAVLENDSGYLSVAYGELAAVFVEAIKEQQQHIRRIEMEQKAQCELIAALESRLRRVEAGLA